MDAHNGLSDTSFSVGNRVLVAGGYEQRAEWVKGGPGYLGQISEIENKWMIVQLDSELALEAAEGSTWPNLGGENIDRTDGTTVAHGRWLALRLAYVGQEWIEPIARIHVVLCEERPDISENPEIGVIGAWVESHATVRRIAPRADTA